MKPQDQLSYWIRDERIKTGIKVINAEDVKQAIKNLKKVGLKKTPYPKYLLLTLDDLIEVFGDALATDSVVEEKLI